MGEALNFPHFSILSVFWAGLVAIGGLGVEVFIRLNGINITAEKGHCQ